jgi:hypothetical protein
MRPETGPLVFGIDWPGVFIRGDDARYLAGTLANIAEGINDLVPEFRLQKRWLCELSDLLRSCSVVDGKLPEHLQHAETILRLMKEQFDVR